MNRSPLSQKLYAQQFSEFLMIHLILIEFLTPQLTLVDHIDGRIVRSYRCKYMHNRHQLKNTILIY